MSLLDKIQEFFVRRSGVREEVRILEHRVEMRDAEIRNLEQIVSDVETKLKSMTLYDFIQSRMFGVSGVKFFDYERLDIESKRSYQRAVTGWVESPHWEKERDTLLNTLHTRLIEISEDDAKSIRLIKELMGFLEGMDERWKAIAGQYKHEMNEAKGNEEFKKTELVEQGVYVPPVNLGI